MSQEARRKVGDAHRGKPLSNAHCEKLSLSHKGKRLSSETRRKMSVVRTGQKRTEETKKRQSEAAIQKYKNLEARQKIAAALMGHSVTDAFKKRMSEAIKALWQDADYSNKQSKAIIAGSAKRPNKAELALLKIISPFGFCYVGDGELIIKRKNPDFVDNKNRLIELFGDYWHAGQSPDDRIDFFRKEGWECLVIWESELKFPDKIKERVGLWTC